MDGSCGLRSVNQFNDQAITVWAVATNGCGCGCSCLWSESRPPRQSSEGLQLFVLSVDILHQMDTPPKEAFWINMRQPFSQVHSCLAFDMFISSVIYSCVHLARRCVHLCASCVSECLCV